MGRNVQVVVTGGKDALDRPSLALALPNGDIIVNDDYNHRSSSWKTDRIVWHARAASPAYSRFPTGST